MRGILFLINFWAGLPASDFVILDLGLTGKFGLYEGCWLFCCTAELWLDFIFGDLFGPVGFKWAWEPPDLCYADGFSWVGILPLFLK